MVFFPFFLFFLSLFITVFFISVFGLVAPYEVVPVAPNTALFFGLFALIISYT